MPIAENINAAVTCTPPPTGPPFAAQSFLLDPDPPPKSERVYPQGYGYDPKRREPKRFPGRDWNHGTLSAKSRETWPGDDPPRTMAPLRVFAGPPFVEDRPPGKYMEESFQVSYPPPEDKYHKPGSYFDRFRRWGLDPGMRFNGNPSREKWPGDDPPRTEALSQSHADPPPLGNRPSGMSLKEACQNTDPPPASRSRKQQPYLARFRRRQLDLTGQLNVNPSREKWPGDDPPRTKTLTRILWRGDPAWSCRCSYVMQVHNITIQKIFLIIQLLNPMQMNEQ